LGSILVVVGIISILTLVIYWYVFSEDPSIPYGTPGQEAVANQFGTADRAAPSGNTAAGDKPDDRTVVVETPSSSGGVDIASIPDNSGEKPPAGISAAADPATLSSGVISVQVGAFSKPDGARQLASQLAKQGFHSGISSSDGMYRVFVGEFNSKEQAEDMASRLKSSGFSGYIRKVP